MNSILSLIKKTALIVVSAVSLAVGVLGVILPVLPGTPFLILSAVCWKLAVET